MFWYPFRRRGQGKVVFYKGKGSQPYRFRIVAANGEKLAAGEGYSSKRACEMGVNAIRRALSYGTVVRQW